MAFEFLAVLLIIAVMGTPGIMLSFALLKGVKLNKADKTIIGLILGILTNPLLSFVEFALFQVPLSSMIVIMNAIFIFIIGLVALFLQKQLSFSFSGAKKYFSEAYYKDLLENRPVAIGVYALLLILLLAGFYARFATSWSTSFFEFDPYYYDKVTEQIVLHGSAPLKSDISYYPRFRSYRELPMIHYMTGSWYLLYKDFTGGAFNQDQLILTIQFYPPLVGAFLIFLAFLFIREESNKYVGLIAAAMFAFTPQLIKKLGAGVSEQAPMGMFAAMLVFAIYALAINRKSMRLGVLAAFSMLITILGSAHSIWPIMILAAFVFIISILEYATGEFNYRDFKINLLVAAGALLANLLLMIYKALPLSVGSISVGVLFFTGALVPSAIFFLSQRFQLDSRFTRKQILAGMFALLLLFSIITPVATSGIGFVNSLLRYAKADTPLNRTVQEENATSEGLFASSFGVLNPNQLLIASTVLLVILGMLALRKKGLWYAAGYGLFAFILVVLNKYVDLLFSAISGLFASSVPEISLLFRFIVEGDVFLYLLISLLSVMIFYYYEEKSSKMTLLFLLAFFPTAYIGLSKVKYLLHLAFALALALPFVLMMLNDLVERLNKAFKLISNAETLRMGMLIFIGLIGIVAAYKQYETVGQSMLELQYSRITSDWTDATKWMRANLNENDRLISWWDYGHWITFFGGAKTVLDPSNYYQDYDQQTAHAFVDGNTSELIDVMHYHKATYILVDSELVPKWGALVYLSGTYAGLTDDPNYKNTPDIPSTSSPGQSEYETEHYFEYIYAVLQQVAGGGYQPASCPGVIPKQMFYSSFGAAYCIDGSGKLFLLSSDGQQKELKPPALVRSDDSQIAPAPLGNNLFYNTRYAFINLDPDLEGITDGRLKSNLFNSAFVQLFFYEKLDGFQLSYKSPNNQVKIFKLLV